MLGNPAGQAEVDLSRESAQRRQASEGIWYAETCNTRFNTVFVWNCVCGYKLMYGFCLGWYWVIVHYPQSF